MRKFAKNGYWKKSDVLRKPDTDDNKIGNFQSDDNQGNINNKLLLFTFSRTIGTYRINHDFGQKRPKRGNFT